MSTIRQEFTCPCGKTVVGEIADAPLCCNAPMKPKNFHIPADLQLRYIHVPEHKHPDWLRSPPVAVSELWKLGKAGRHDGEQLGWIVEYTTYFHWRTVDGPPADIREGQTAEVHTACLAIMCALDGGIFAKRRIAELVRQLEAVPA